MPVHLFLHLILTTTPGEISVDPIFQMRKEVQTGEVCPPRGLHAVSGLSVVSSSARI